MLTVKHRFETFEEYLSYNDDSEQLYELFNGELIEIPPESGFNVEIANFLLLKLASLVGHRRVRGHGLELEVRGEPKNRYPDLTIIREEHIQQLSKRNTIRLSMPPPLLVVEVVSPGDTALCPVIKYSKQAKVPLSKGDLGGSNVPHSRANCCIQRDRDYIAKRMQYQDCGIPEYWIVDPQTQTILILELRRNSYAEVGSFSNGDLLLSPGFRELNLKVSEVFGKE